MTHRSTAPAFVLLSCLSLAPPPADDLAATVRAQADFALELHRALVALDPAANAFASPLSVWTALAMLSEGARGRTAEELRAALWGGTEPLPAGVRAQRERLAALDGPVTLAWADALWGERSFEFSAPTLARLREAYGVEVTPLDFAGEPEAARARINAWVEERTNERIHDLLPSGSIDELTRLVLTDAVYFLGRWEEAFAVEDGAELPFARADGSSVTVPFLRAPKGRAVRTAVVEGTEEAAEGGVRHGRVTLLELPYQGGALTFVVVLPEAADGLAALERSLDGARLAGWLERLQPAEVALSLPRLELQPGYELSGPFERLGLATLMDPRAADLTGLAAREADGASLYVSGAFHKAFLKVDEQGTEAAAATGVVVATRAALPPPEVRVDRPFLFLIRDRESGSLLFLGRIADPSAG